MKRRKLKRKRWLKIKYVECCLFLSSFFFCSLYLVERRWKSIIVVSIHMKLPIFVVVISCLGCSSATFCLILPLTAFHSFFFTTWFRFFLPTVFFLFTLSLLWLYCAVFITQNVLEQNNRSATLPNRHD